MVELIRPPGSPWFEAEYRLRTSDLVAFNLANTSRTLPRTLLFVFVVMAISGAATVLMMGGGFSAVRENFRYLVEGFRYWQFYVAIFILLPLLAVVWPFVRAWRLGKSDPSQAPTHLSLYDTGAWFETPTGAGFLPWAECTKVVRGRWHLLLYRKMGFPNIIPLRSLGESASALEVAARCANLQNTAHQKV
jgi:hypothetical protein